MSIKQQMGLEKKDRTELESFVLPFISIQLSNSHKVLSNICVKTNALLKHKEKALKEKLNIMDTYRENTDVFLTRRIRMKVIAMSFSKTSDLNTVEQESSNFSNQQIIDLPIGKQNNLNKVDFNSYGDLLAEKIH